MRQKYLAQFRDHSDVTVESLACTICYLVDVKSPVSIEGFDPKCRREVKDFYKCVYHYSTKALNTTLNVNICFLLEIFLIRAVLETLWLFHCSAKFFR